MSGCFSVWIMWTGNCRDVLRSTEAFQSLAPFSSFILEFICFLTGHLPSLWNWIMGSLGVTSCWFAATHYALNNSLTNSNTFFCCHVYIWSDNGHADSIWREIPDSLVAEGNFVFWFGAQFNLTHNFTQSGWPILFNPDPLSGQQKLGKLPNTLSLAEQRRPVQMSHWRFFNSSSSMDTWGNLSNLWIPCVYFPLDQGIPVEYELDTFNTLHIGTTLCHPQNWLCRCDA